MTEAEARIYFLKTAPILFGRYWKTYAGRYLGKTQSTIMNWRKGRTPVPSLVITMIEACMQQGLCYDAETGAMRKNKND